MKRLIPIIFFLFCAASCSKTPEEEKDKQAPTIDLFRPADQEIFNGSQNLLITGAVSDNKYIKEIHLEITNLITAEEYLHVHIHPNAASFNFSQNFTLQKGISYKIRVVADDASSNSTVKKVEIACN